MRFKRSYFTQIIGEIRLEIPPSFQDLDALWNPSNPLSSEQAFQALLPEAKQLEGEARFWAVELLTRIARAQGAQGKLAEAKSSLSTAEQLLEEGQSTFPVSAKIRWMLEKGRFYILDKTPSQARALFLAAWNLATTTREDAFAVDIAQIMATIEPQKVQQEWISRAVEIAEKSDQPFAKRALGSLFSTQAWKLYDVRQFEKSLDMFHKALKQFEAHGTNREAFVAKWSIGRILRALNRFDEALVVQKSLLAELGIGGVRDGRVFAELGECLQALKKPVEAQPYFALAYEELSKDQWFMDNESAQLKRIKDLGKAK